MIFKYRARHLGAGPCAGPPRTDSADVEPGSRISVGPAALSCSISTAPQSRRNEPQRRAPRRSPGRAESRRSRRPGHGTEPPRSPLGAIPTRPGGHSHPRGEDLDAVLGRHGCGGAGPAVTAVTGGAGSGCHRSHRRNPGPALAAVTAAVT